MHEAERSEDTWQAIKVQSAVCGYLNVMKISGHVHFPNCHESSFDLLLIIVVDSLDASVLWTPTLIFMSVRVCTATNWIQGISYERY